MSALDYPNTYKPSPLKFRPNLLILGGGPTNPSDRVLAAMAQTSLIPTSPEIFQIMDEIQEMLKFVYQTENKLTLVTQTSGNGGNETILVNLVEPGERIIVAIAGIWGEKVVDMAKRYNIDVVALRKGRGEIYGLMELEAAIIKYEPVLLFVTHGEPTGGTLQKLEGIGQICHKHNCLLAVDAVVSICVAPLFVDRWEIDAVTGGSQKGLGAPAGMSLMTFSPRAQKRMFQKKCPTPYYFDIKSLGDVWNCFGNPRTYHYTFSSNMLAAVREGLAEICEEGLENVWKRHSDNAELFWEQVESLGLEIFVTEPENRFTGVTCVNHPKDVDWVQLLQFIRKKYRIDTSPGYGPTLGKAIRFGFLGPNSRREIVEYLVEALKDGLNHLRTL